jgi:hypothetical protein
MATLAEQVKKATHAVSGNPLNVADQGAYDSVFLKALALNGSRCRQRPAPISRRCRKD